MALTGTSSEIYDLLPDNQRQRRTCYASCHILYPVSAAHTNICRMDSNSTLYAAQVDLTTVLINEYPWVDGIDGDLITLREWSVMDTVTLNPEFSDTLGFGRFEPS